MTAFNLSIKTYHRFNTTFNNQLNEEMIEKSLINNKEIGNSNPSENDFNLAWQLQIEEINESFKQTYGIELEEQVASQLLEVGTKNEHNLLALTKIDTYKRIYDDLYRENREVTQAEQFQPSAPPINTSGYPDSLSNQLTRMSDY